MIFRQFLHTDPVVAAYVTRTGKTAASSGRPPLNRQIWEGLVLNA